MGTPKSQKLVELMALIVMVPNYRVSEAELHGLSVDVGLLEMTYDRAIKPYMKYLSGYTIFRDSVGYVELMKNSLVSGQLARFGDTQILRLLDAELMIQNETLPKDPDIALKVWLTRKGEWVVWTAQKQQGAKAPGGWDAYSNEQVRSFESVREMCAFLDEIVPEKFFVRGRTKRHVPGFLPLMIERSLQEVLGQTVAERRKRLSVLERAYGMSKGISAAVDFPAY